MKLNRRNFVCTGAALGSLAGWSTNVFAQQSDLHLLEQIRIVCGFPPGGTTDAASRRIADKLRGSYAKVSLVDNKVGASGRIALEDVRRSPADGRVMLLQPETVMTLMPHVDPRNTNYKLEDLTPVAGCGVVQYGFSVGPLVPESVKTLKDYLAWAKANLKDASFGSPGVGSPQQFLVTMLAKAAGVSLNHVGYRGSAPGIQDMLGGQISAMCSPVGDSFPHLKGGKLRLLATSGARRSRFTPDVPTFVEQGFAGLEMQEWYGIFMNKAVPRALVTRAATAVRQAVAVPEVADAFALMGIDSQTCSSEELSKLLQDNYAMWGQRVKSLGFVPAG